MKKLSRTLVLLALLCSTLFAFAQQQIPPEYLALNDLYAGQVVSWATPWPWVPFGALRLWDSGTDWNLIETSRGVYNWSNLDNWVQMAQSHGAKVEFTFGRTPSWASSAITLPPSNMQDWDDFVTAVATRYKGRIEAYEVWNEVNSSAFYTGSTAALVTMQQHAYKIIKSIDPTAFVLSPSFAGGGMGDLNNFLAAGAAPYMDGVAVHLYPYPVANPGAEVNVPSWIDGYRSYMNQYGLNNKPLWNTEFGWGLNSNLSNADDQDAFLARSYLLYWSKGVARSYWYAYDNDSWGTLRLPNSGTPGTITAAGYAYKTLYSWMVGQTMSKPCAQDSNSVWACQLSKPDGSTELVAWNPNGSSSYAAGSYTQYQDLSGTVTAITGGAVTVGKKPIMLQNSSAGSPPPPPPSTSAGVVVSSPANGSTVASPVHFVATANGGNYPITAMRIYDNNSAAYTVYAASLNTVLSLGAGTHNMVVQAWNSTGQVFKQSITVTVTGGTSTGVSIQSPSGSSSSTPVPVIASATAPAGRTISAMRIYVDSVSRYTVYSGSVNTSLTMSAGTHNIIINAWDNTGAVYQAKVNITVP